MKTNKTKKNPMKAFIFIALTLALNAAFASDENPFLDGTEEVKLTEEEMIELKAYAENTKSILDKALHEAKGKLIHETLLIYRRAIYKAIPQSFEKKKHSELLIRFILNQALDLVDGTPNAYGERREDGVLKNSSNKALTTAIYKNSIDLALRYYPKDMEAISEGTFKDTPYNEMASQRLLLAKKWAGGVLEQNLKFKFLNRVLEHWLLTVSQKANLRRKEVAHLIVDVQDSLEEVKSYRTTDERVRFLNGVIKWVLEQIKEQKEKRDKELKEQKEKRDRELKEQKEKRDKELKEQKEKRDKEQREKRNKEQREERNKRKRRNSHQRTNYTPNSWKFRTQTKYSCYGHIKGVFTNQEKTNVQCYSNDLSQWDKSVNRYYTEQKFGCAEGFIEGFIDSDGSLKCWKRSYLESKEGYGTEQKFGCAEGFLEGFIDSYGGLKCWNRKVKERYWIKQKFGCAEGFVEGKIRYGELECWNRSHLESKEEYWAEPKFGCAEGFVEGIIDSYGDLKCIK